MHITAYYYTYAINTLSVVIVAHTLLYRLRDGLKHILNMSRLGNAYMQANKPWTLVKQGPDDQYTILGHNLACFI